MSEKDFDFEIGNWTVLHKRLVHILDNCTDWYEFNGSSSTRSILNGFGNVEDNVLQMPEGDINAAAFRTYDVESNKWSIWWVDMRNPHKLDIPVIGEFVDNIGNFYSEDIFNGVPIKVRFTWESLTENMARWTQAFSDDEGENWEINWTMDFTRVPAQ